MPVPVPVIAAGIAGGASLLGSAFSAVSSASQAKKQRDWQEEMSNTAHQREVKDLQKAGLNPILSAKLGGASTPPGAMADVPDYGRGVSSAVEAASVAGALRLQKAQAADLEASATLKNSQNIDMNYTQEQRLMNLQAEYRKMLADTSLSHQNKQLVQQQLVNLTAQLDGIRTANQASAYGLAEAARTSEFFQSKLGKAAAYRKHLGSVVGAVSTAKEAYESFGPKAKAWLQKNFPVRNRQRGASGRY